MATPSTRQRVGFQTVRKLAKGREPEERQQQGVDKIELGLEIAFILARGPEAMHLGEIAKAADLPPSKVHRFLVSLCRSNLVEQDPMDGKYHLGGGAIALGLAAQNRLDAFRLGDQALRALHDATGQNCALVVWGDRGPTVVRRIEPFQPITVSSRIGSSIPVLNSASGRVFAAFLPSSVTRPLIETELASGLKPTIAGRQVSLARFERMLGDVRATGLAEALGDLFHGFDSLSAPVFDSAGGVPMALSLLGSAGAFSRERGGEAYRETLVESARQLSAKLGGTWMR
ncbi:IclR family transcriptional regulator [Aquabacter sp. P-9]|uniref:IclR family transcriptional regulator n=1 Tax=Aquabacter sediminis TaxID=3029197 RepID=UPI00237ED709|nr:IclR family transcriptional regulator [Aquabacter sp. P-9]MDE1570332.1 IclR family transcriptional regulator [Aquabacter sp. P-9]